MGEGASICLTEKAVERDMSRRAEIDKEVGALLDMDDSFLATAHADAAQHAGDSKAAEPVKDGQTVDRSSAPFPDTVLAILLL